MTPHDWASMPSTFKDALCCVAAFICSRSHWDNRSLCVGAIQVTRMNPRASRGMHTDNVNQGDVLTSVTLTGSATVEVTKVTRKPALQSPGDFYVLYGDARYEQEHSVRAGPDGRLSLTLRLMWI